jgi:hypothetical protein
MPIQYYRDDAEQRVTVTITRPVTLSSLKDFVNQEAAGRAWKYGVLCDARSMSEPLSPLNTWELMEHVREVIAARGPRGPVAIVAATTTTAAIARLYAVVWQHATNLQFKTFYDVAAAEKWLDELRRSEVEPSGPEHSGGPTVPGSLSTGDEPTRASTR